MFTSEGSTDSTRLTAPSERDLQTLQRLAMVGTLAGGLGHDLRNIVMPALLRLDVLRASDSIPDAARADLAAIRESLLQLQRLAGGLRLLSRDARERSEVQYTRVGPWWDEVRPLVVDALSASTVLEDDVASTLPDACVPPSVVAQVLMNLAMNAQRAMEGVERPVFRVRARRVGQEVHIEVSDNGIGMDEETRERCFEPFFTTRPRELSTGLGLSTGRALLTSFGGDLMVDASTTVGSTFVMVLPAPASIAREDRVAQRTVRFLIADPRQLAVLRLIVRQRGLLEWSRGAQQPPHYIVGDTSAIATLRASSSPDDAIDASTQLIAVGSDAPETDVPNDVQWVDVRHLPSLGDLLR